MPNLHDFDLGNMEETFDQVVLVCKDITRTTIQCFSLVIISVCVAVGILPFRIILQNKSTDISDFKRNLVTETTFVISDSD